MEQEFWHQRWDSGQIAFHQSEVNAELQRLWPQLGVPAGGRVFVPLCGKSLDMVWLAEAGHPVLGVELSPRALAEFCAEHALDAEIARHGGFERYSAPPYELLAGDVFDLEPDWLVDVRGYYDRAALIALPPDMRARYVDHLAALLPAGTRGLLITLEYVEGSKSGPPHHVAADEVRARYATAGFEVELLEAGEPLPAPPPFRKAGLERLRELCWRVVRR